MGRQSAMAHPSPWLVGLLAAGLVVNISDVGAMSPEEPAFSVSLGGEDALDNGGTAHESLGEAEEGMRITHKISAPKWSAKGKAMVEQKKVDLKHVERLLKNPIISPVQEREFKKAEKAVAKAKSKIMSELASVVQMGIFSQRVTEVQAKKAASDAESASQYGQLAGGAMEQAAKKSRGCEDNHMALCLGVKMQGHCGIKAYAKSCKLSCNVCKKGVTFKFSSQKERDRKREVRAAARRAAASAEKKIKTKETKTKAKVEKTKTKMQAALRKEEEKREKLNQEKARVAGLSNAREGKKKVAEAKVARAKEKSEKAKEQLKKDSRKLKPQKVSKSPLRSAKEIAKKKAATVKRVKAAEKKQKTKTKKD